MSATLRFDNIGKVFPGVRALDGVFRRQHRPGARPDGRERRGQIDSAENSRRPIPARSGRLLIDGTRCASRARIAIEAGIAVIHQELQYVPELTVTENLLLGRLPRFGWVNKREAKRSCGAARAIGVDLDPTRS